METMAGNATSATMTMTRYQRICTSIVQNGTFSAMLLRKKTESLDATTAHWRTFVLSAFSVNMQKQKKWLQRNSMKANAITDLVPEFSLCLRLFISIFFRIKSSTTSEGRSGLSAPTLKFVTFGRLSSWNSAFRADIFVLVTAKATRHRLPTKLSVSRWNERSAKPRSNNKSHKISRCRPNGE